MIQKIGTLTIFVLLLTAMVNAKDPSWLLKFKEIKPLTTTEKEVESIYGKPVQSFSNIRKYKAKEGVIQVNYSTGKCSQKTTKVTDDYDVEKGIAINVWFRIDKQIKFSALRFNLLDFEEDHANDIDGTEYISRTLGISYSKSAKYLNSIFLFPSTRFKHLQCQKEEN